MYSSSIEGSGPLGALIVEEVMQTQLRRATSFTKGLGSLKAHLDEAILQTCCKYTVNERHSKHSYPYLKVLEAQKNKGYQKHNQTRLYTVVYS